MPKRIVLHEFAGLRRALERERSALQQRLHQIEAALDDGQTSSRQTLRRARASKLTVREAISKVTASKSLSILDIVKAVQKIGYKFKSRNPQNSVGAYLYGAEGRKHFRRENGRFRPLR
jgi:hypothetical protein